jgi:hypothetical protein
MYARGYYIDGQEVSQEHFLKETHGVLSPDGETIMYSHNDITPGRSAEQVKKDMLHFMKRCTEVKFVPR